MSKPHTHDDCVQCLQVRVVELERKLADATRANAQREPGYCAAKAAGVCDCDSECIAIKDAP